jgi:uncharacterized protein (DUF305 family)
MVLPKGITVTAGMFALAVTLAACGDDGTGAATSQPTSGAATTTSTSTDTGSTPSTPASVDAAHNDTDVQFAQMMIVHHGGAIEMAEFAMTKAESPDVQQLAERIAAAQGPEIETMSAWLQAWGEQVPEGMSMDGMDGMGRMADMGGMPGMEMDMDAAMAELELATGAEFDRMFLEMMIEHHQGAVEMSQTEQAEGENPQALELAATIEADQTAEIQEMQQLLQTL